MELLIKARGLTFPLYLLGLMGISHLFALCFTV